VNARPRPDERRIYFSRHSYLYPDTTLARKLIGKDRFTDQSGINRLLHRFTEENLRELGEVCAMDYLVHGLAGKRPRDEIIIDLDMTGFKASGASYKGAEKGVHRKGKEGSKRVKASFAYMCKCGEVLGCLFDKGNANEDHHIDQLLEIVKLRIGSPKIRDIILRGDPAYGKSSIVDKCIEHGYTFLFKGMHTSSARRYAKRIKEWIKIDKQDEELYAGEFRGRMRESKHIIRTVVFKHVKDGKEEY